MANVDAAMVGARVPEAERVHPRTTAFPSVARQIVWQTELNEIAAGFERDFFLVRRLGPTPDVIILDAPWEPPSPNALGWIAVSAIQKAQGRISEDLRERPLPPDLRFERTPSKPRKSLGAFAAPVRLAPTGIALVDEMIPQVLAEIRARHPQSKLDDASFPASAGAANLIIPPQRFGGEGRWKALACAREIYCDSFADFTRNYDPNAPARSPKGSFAFLDSIYLTNPYGEREGITAVIHLSKDGEIIASFCSINDIRYRPGLINGPWQRPEDLRTCLEQAMGY